MKFQCPLDISAHYFGYSPEFVKYLKSRGWLGYIDQYHKAIFAKEMAKRGAK